MQSYSIKQETRDGITVFHFIGYFHEETGKELTKLLAPHFQNGAFEFVFNFKECPLVNSPGLVTLFSLASQITEELQGKLVLVGLSDLQFQVFRTISLHQVSDFGKDVDDGLKLIKA